MDSSFILSKSDVEALLLSLPLVISSPLAETADQKQRNNFHTVTATQKLLSSNPHFTPDELRVMFAAVSIAKLLLAGQAPELFEGVDPETRADLSPYLFTLNKLEGMLGSTLNRIEFLFEP